MKIDRLSLKDITRYSDFEFDFDRKMTMFYGRNAAGKTTLVDAMTFALAKSCARTDKAGKGADTMIRSGQEHGSIGVTVTVDGKSLKVGRGLSAGKTQTYVEDFGGKEAEKQAAVLEFLGVDANVLRAALSTDGFLDLSTAEQKAMLFNLLGLSFDRADITKQVVEEVAPDGEAAQKMLDAAPSNLWTGDGATFGNLHKHFYDLRRNVSREVKEMGVPPEIPPAVDDSMVEGTRAEIKRLRDERYAVMNEASAVKKRNEERDALMEALLDLQTRFENAGHPEEARREHEELGERLGVLEREIGGRKAAVNVLMDTASEVRAAQNCPMSPEVPCPLTAEDRVRIADDMEAKAQKVVDELAPLEEELLAVVQRKADLAPEIRKDSKAALKEAITRHEARMREAGVHEDLDEAKVQAEAEALAQRADEMEATLLEVVKAQGARGQVIEAHAKRDEILKREEVLNALVKALSPSGLPGRILAGAIAPVETRANDRLQALTGGAYKLSIVHEPDFGVYVTHDGATTDLKRLSTSERMRIGVVLQDALVSLTGLKFLLLDNAEVLDRENFRLMMNALAALQDEYEQIVVFVTSEVLPEMPVHPEDIENRAGAYLLKDGKVVEA